jgi:transcriptional regulator with XRE-family HTH domain
VLGQFLRAKRRRIAPNSRGMSSTRRRLVAGLSREETAALADIGASWYARLEAGRVPNPTLGTMRAVAQALQLSSAETSFVYELAGLIAPNATDTGALAAAQPLIELLRGNGLVAGMTLWDRFMMPVAWNAISDGMYLFSTFDNAIDRHPLVRLDSEFALNFFGDDYEPWARNAVGIFRRSYSTGEPPAYAREVFERAETRPSFRRFWGEHLVADSVTPYGTTFVRHHPLVGTFSASAIDLAVPEQQGHLRIISPADADAREKLERLRERGIAFSGELLARRS